MREFTKAQKARHAIREFNTLTDAKAAIIKGNAQEDSRYAKHYASDNPIKTGSTLAAGAMGKEGVKPTYLITKVILEKIMGNR